MYVSQHYTVWTIRARKHVWVWQESYLDSQILHQVYFKLDNLIGKPELRDLWCAAGRKTHLLNVEFIPLSALSHISLLLPSWFSTLQISLKGLEAILILNSESVVLLIILNRLAFSPLLLHSLDPAVSLIPTHFQMILFQKNVVVK